MRMYMIMQLLHFILAIKKESFKQHNSWLHTVSPSVRENPSCNCPCAGVQTTIYSKSDGILKIEYIEKSANFTYLQQITRHTKIDIAFGQNIILFLFDKAIIFVLENIDKLGSVIYSFVHLQAMDKAAITFELIEKTFDFIGLLSDYLIVNDINKANKKLKQQPKVNIEIKASLTYALLIFGMDPKALKNCDILALKDKLFNKGASFKKTPQKTFLLNCEDSFLQLVSTLEKTNIKTAEYMVFIDLCKILHDLSICLASSFLHEKLPIFEHIRTFSCFFNVGFVQHNVDLLFFLLSFEYLIHMFETGFFPDSPIKLNYHSSSSLQNFQVVRLIGVLYGVQKTLNNKHNRNIDFLTFQAIDIEVLEAIELHRERVNSNAVLLNKAYSIDENSKNPQEDIVFLFSSYLKNTINLFSSTNGFKLKNKAISNKKH